MKDYKNIISHIDIDRSLGAIEYFSFNGLGDPLIFEFLADIEDGNDSIELHLIKSKAYKEALLLRLKKNDSIGVDEWKIFLKDEQKTFGGSKIFYIDNNCSRLLLFSIPNEMRGKINMVVTRLNKINEKISRINAKIKKDNLELFELNARIKGHDRRKEEVINFINQNLRV